MLAAAGPSGCSAQRRAVASSFPQPSLFSCSTSQHTACPSRGVQCAGTHWDLLSTAGTQGPAVGQGTSPHLTLSRLFSFLRCLMQCCRTSICWRRRGESFTWMGPEPPPVTWSAPTPADRHQQQQHHQPSHVSAGQDSYSSTGYADRLSKGTSVCSMGGSSICLCAPRHRWSHHKHAAPTTEKAKTPARQGSTSPPPCLLSSPAPGTPGAHFPKARGCATLWTLQGPISPLQESHHSAPIAVSCSPLPSRTPGTVQECTSHELPCSTGCWGPELSTALEQDLHPSPCSQTKPCPRAMLGCLGTLVPPRHALLGARGGGEHWHAGVQYRTSLLFLCSTRRGARRKTRRSRIKAKDQV